MMFSSLKVPITTQELGMSLIQPSRLCLAAGLALSFIACSSQPAATQKPDSKPDAKPAATAAAQPETPATPARPAQAPTRAGRNDNGQPAAVRGPTPTGRYNGTPPEVAKKPGSYMVLNGAPAPVPNVKLGDKATVAKIIDEGKNRNQVMDHLTHITTKIGPRLTGSANAETANRWAMEQFQAWGLHAELNEWGTIPVRFDRGPSSAKIGTKSGDEFRSQRELEFTTPAWAAGTNGPIVGQVIKMPENEEQFEAVKDKIKGSWILFKANVPGRRGVGPLAGGAAARQRFFAETRKKVAAGELKLADPAPKPEPKPEAKAEQPADGIAGTWEGLATGGRIPEGGAPFSLEIKLEGGRATGAMSYPNYHSGPIKEANWDEAAKTLTFAWEGPGGSFNYSFKLDGKTITGESKRNDGSVVALTASRGQPSKNDSESTNPSAGPSLDERIVMLEPAGYISSAGAEIVRTGGSYRGLSIDNLPKDCEIQVRASDYDYMNSRVMDGATIFAEINCDNRFTAGPIKCYNTVAEIKGTEFPDEVVIVSAHLDSWNGPGSQGTTDNGTGSSVTLEAARILATVGAKPKRTIRFILWTGEEQGLLGSRAYVKQLKEADKLKNISAVFVDDGGTNFEGGLHILDSQLDIFGAATAPVNGVFWSATDNRFLDVNLQPGRRAGGGMAGGSSDHASFIAEGVPGYFWDEVGRADYPFGWHTQNDKLNLAIPEYLIQSSTCAAITAYNVACAPTLLPREPLPQNEDKKDQTTSLPGGWQQFPTAIYVDASPATK